MPTTLVDWVQVLSFLITAVSVAYAAFFYRRNERKKRLNEEVELMERANEPFRNFLELQLQYPNLGMHTSAKVHLLENLSDEDRVRQRVMSEFLLSILENAYYLSGRGQPLHGEWPVWDAWLRISYADNPNFRYWWFRLDEQGANAFGAEFVDYMRKLLGTERPAAS